MCCSVTHWHARTPYKHSRHIQQIQKMYTSKHKQHFTRRNVCFARQLLYINVTTENCCQPPSAPTPRCGLVDTHKPQPHNDTTEALSFIISTARVQGSKGKKCTNETDFRPHPLLGRQPMPRSWPSNPSHWAFFWKGSTLVIYTRCSSAEQAIQRLWNLSFWPQLYFKCVWYALSILRLHENLSCVLHIIVVFFWRGWKPLFFWTYRFRPIMYICNINLLHQKAIKL